MPNQVYEDKEENNVQKSVNSERATLPSNVNIYTGSKQTQDYNAEAMTQGQNIYFAEEDPDQETIKHEVSHLEHQDQGVPFKGVGKEDDSYEKDADKKAKTMPDIDMAPNIRTDNEANVESGQPIQRLMKKDYPWKGIVTHNDNIAVRETASKDEKDPHKNTLADLPKGTKVDVIGNSGNWLNIKVDTGQSNVVVNEKGKKKGNPLEGYSSEENIDDAAAYTMGQMVDGKDDGVWKPAPGGGNDFSAWVMAKKEDKSFKVDKGTSINCWEMVFYCSYLVGATTWQSLHDKYAQLMKTYKDEKGKGLSEELATKIAFEEMQKSFASAATEYDIRTKKPLPNRGDLLFFDGLNHVAISAGGDKMYTFWTPSTSFGDVEKVKEYTMEQMIKEWKPVFGKDPKVTFGKPTW